MLPSGRRKVSFEDNIKQYRKHVANLMHLVTAMGSEPVQPLLTTIINLCVSIC